MKIFVFLLSFISALTALTEDVLNDIYEQNKNKIQKVILDDEQEKIYKQLQKNSDTKNTFYQLEPIEIIMEQYEEECVEIENIIFIGSTIIEEDTLNSLKKPYLNNCEGIKKLTNLANKISNIYLEKGYATSRAYLKIQDLSDGEVKITILEGKISSLKSENVYIGNTYTNLKNKILNLRDLEAGIIQHERLRSKIVSLKLIPSEEVGFTDVVIVGKDVSNPFYGSISINNNGTKLTGKYQIALSLHYENLFGINDTFTSSINTTDTAFKKTNNSLGGSITYSLPYLQNYFTFSYSEFNYEQTIKDTFGESIISEGISKTYAIAYEYNLYNSQRHAFKINADVSKKESKNYLNDVKLDLQSYIIGSGNISLKHIYTKGDINYYMIFKVQKGLDIFDDKKKSDTDNETNFAKYIMDINFAKSVFIMHNGRFNSSAHLQYSKYNVYGTEQISIGGPYSVRGFKNGGINGYIGGYIRNDLSINKYLYGVSISPYIGIDYGYIKKDKDILGGNIVGASTGLRTNYKSNSLEVYYNKPIQHTKETKITSEDFLGVKYAYLF